LLHLPPETGWRGATSIRTGGRYASPCGLLTSVGFGMVLRAIEKSAKTDVPLPAGRRSSVSAMAAECRRTLEARVL